MARHDAVYRSESIESKARDVDDKIISEKQQSDTSHVAAMLQ